MLRLLATCLFASPLLAQGGPIFLVDAANGSGTDYVDVQAAVLAVPDGSVLRVRPGLRAGPSGVLCAVLVSLRATPSNLPPLPDPIWLDAASMIVEASGITPASGTFSVTKIVPNNPVLRGFEFVWQSADLDATGLLAVSNPSPSVVR